MILARLWIILGGSGSCGSGMRVEYEILMMKCKNCLRNGYGQFCKCYCGFSVLGVGLMGMFGLEMGKI